jgi:predicted secreted protein
VLLTQWPGRTLPLDRWDIPLRPFNGGPEPDSAVVMYWNEQALKAGAKREVGFSYGLGSLSVSSNKHLGISVGGSFTPGGSMTVVALVNEPAKGETLELKLPLGLKLLSDSAKQTVPGVPEGAQAQQSPVTWHIQAEREGTFTIEILSSTNVTQKKSITIKTKTIW